MDQRFFNRLLHLINEKPKEGKRMIGLSANALWELWQRIAEQERIKKEQQAKRAGRQRQIGGGRKKSAQLLCRLLVALLYIRQHWTMQALAECAGCAESTIWNYIHEMEPSQ